MSALSQFVGGGNKIKSIQRGVSTGSGTFTNTISISTVNPSKSIVYFNSQNGFAATSGGSIVSSGYSIILSGSTNVIVAGYSSFGAYLSFEVVEFY